MARSGSTHPAISAGDSLRPIALESMRATKKRKAEPAEPRAHGRAWFVLWFLGAAVFSFSAMAALERRGLSQLLMPARLAPADVTVVEPPIRFSAARRTPEIDDVLLSPWRHADREPDEPKAPAASVVTSDALAAVVATATATPAPKKEPPVTASKKEPPVIAPKKEPPVTTSKKEPPVIAPKKEPPVTTSKKEPTAKPAAPRVAPPPAPSANPAGSSSDEVAAAAAMLEKAKGEHALE